jgi:hypothetical protein
LSVKTAATVSLPEALGADFNFFLDLMATKSAWASIWDRNPINKIAGFHALLNHFASARRINSGYLMWHVVNVKLYAIAIISRSFYDVCLNMWMALAEMIAIRMIQGINNSVRLVISLSIFSSIHNCIRSTLLA